MQLYYFLAILLSLSFGSLPPSHHSPVHGFVFTGLVILAWWGLCLLAARLVHGLIRDGDVSIELGYDWFQRQTECFRWLSLGLIVLCLGGFGLGRNLDELPIAEYSLAAQSIVLLTPAVLMMAGLHTSEHRFLVRYGIAMPGLLPAIRSVVSSIRISIGWLAIPIIGLMLAIDVVRWTRIETVLPTWLGWIAIAILVVVGVPLLVRRLFPTTSIDPNLKSWIGSLTRAAGLKGCRIVIWDTGGRNHNALMAGVMGRFRVLLLSDRLIQDLTREQLAMVVLHEVAHAKRFHIPIRIASLVPAWLFGAALETSLAGAAVVAWAAEWASILSSLASMVLTIIVLRIVSHRSEYDADEYACVLAIRVAEDCEGVPPTKSEARQRMSEALLEVTRDCESSRRSSWLHPAISDRIAALD